MQQGFYGAKNKKSAQNFSILRKLFRFNTTFVVLNRSSIIENKIYAYIKNPIHRVRRGAKARFYSNSLIFLRYSSQNFSILRRLTLKNSVE